MKKLKKMFDFVIISIYNENIENENLKKTNSKIKFKKLRRRMGWMRTKRKKVF